MRGSVPIIADPHLHNIGLRDEESCIVVANDDWREAARRALAIPQSEVMRLRSSVLAREKRLTADAVGTIFLRRRGTCIELAGKIAAHRAVTAEPAKTLPLP